MKDITYVNVAGFSSSGSSAVVDLLKEFKGCYVPDAEIRFLRDPYGISDLEYSLVTNWDIINSTAAISDFLEIMKKSARPKGLLLPMGFGLKTKIASNIIELAEEYVNELTDFTYKTDYYHYKFKKSYFRYQFDRYRWAIERLSKGKIKLINRNIKTCYFAHPTQEQFNNATQLFFDKLFAAKVNENRSTHIVLDQAVSVNNPDVIHRYFKKAKLIVVDRDPRDMYCDDVNWGDNMDDHYQTKEAAERYVIRAKAMRTRIKQNADILYVRFEDLIVNYESTKKRIIDYLNLREEDHVNKRKFLKPEVSVKNIGIWKDFYQNCKEAIDFLYESFPELCYDFSDLQDK